MANRQFLLRVLMVSVAAMAVGLVWTEGPRLIGQALGPTAEARETAPRGDMTSAEQRMIETFRQAQQSVVFIGTSRRAINPMSMMAEQVPQGTGSGIVWDDRGHVITNNHVIEGASGAFVRMADGSVAQAALVGRSPAHDLAVLKVEGVSAVPIPIAPIEDVQVGQTVLAIGNPFGLDWTLTTGVVSALGRDIDGRGGGRLRGLIQTDAAINPGNSGGALLDSAGRLIGVNTAIFSPSGGSAGIGFAVPIDVVNRVVPQIISTGRYAPPRLGIEYDQRINELARRSGLRGVLVLGIEPRSGADDAGLRPARVTADGRLLPGDVIVGVGAEQVDRAEDLTAALDAYQPGDVVTLRILRDGEQTDLDVRLSPPA